MIIADIKYSGTFIDKPNTRRIMVDEDIIAAEKALPNGKIEKLTAGDLFKFFYLKKSYVTENIDVEDQLTPEHFEIWFREKYLRNTNIYDKIISIAYTRQ